MPLNRRKEREIVFQMLFAAGFSPEAASEDLFPVLLEEREEEGAAESAYIREVFFGARAYRAEAEEKIARAAKGWKLERLSRATRAILLLAVYEMECYEKLSPRIAVNEAVELAKKYDDEKAPKFVNGVLGAVAKEAAGS